MSIVYFKIVSRRCMLSDKAAVLRSVGPGLLSIGELEVYVKIGELF